MDNNYNYQPPAPVKTVSPSSVLVFGILSLALMSIPYIGGIVGFIFSLVARGKVKKYLAENNGQTCGKVKVGSILSTIALIFGIIAVVGTVLLAAYYVFVIIIGIGMSASQYMIPLFFF